MLSPDDIQAKLSEARRIIIDVILDHEREAHDGHICWGNRASAVALVAHSLGLGALGTTGWVFTEALLRDYDQHCKALACEHPRVPRADLPDRDWYQSALDQLEQRRRAEAVTVRPGPGWSIITTPPLEGPIEPGPYHSDGFQHEVDVTSVGEGRVYFIHRSADRYGESAWRDEESFRMCYQRGRPADALPPRGGPDAT
jgi:hypothetical protein